MIEGGHRRRAREEEASRTGIDRVEAAAVVIASDFVQRLSEIAAHEVRLRYELGKFLHSVRCEDRSSWPSAPLQRMSRILGAHPSGLRRCARVTEVLGDDEFEAIASLRSIQGWRVTWSHFELLAEVRSRGMRWQLAQRIIEERLSVRALALRIRALKNQRVKDITTDDFSIVSRRRSSD